MGRDWCWSQQLWPIGPHLFGQGYLATRVVGRGVPSCPLHRWCCNDAQAKNMAHQQAVAFCLPATLKKVHGPWINQSCLAVLRRKGYLGPKDPWMTWHYWEVWKEETVILAIILQQCAIQARAPPDVFCEAVKSSMSAWFWQWKRMTFLISIKIYGRELGRTPMLLLPQQEFPHWKEPP